MVNVGAAVYFFAALMLLILPLDWFLAAFLAAAFHELCHILAVRLAGGRITNVRIGLAGAEIKASLRGRGQELLSILAGPLGSLSLLSLCHVFPKLALCALVQGAFNLLPISPLDGGRALGCILGIACPDWAEKLLRWTEGIVCLVLALLSVGGALWLNLGCFPLAAAGLLIMRPAVRKIPCKRSQIRVQ